MGKRYYCAYCDRSFKDDTEARKKHLSSLQHAKNRADHYNIYKDPEVILKEECAKMPCKRYMTVGDCAFGLGCRYSHYTPPMIWELQRLVHMKTESRLHAMPKNGWPNPDDITKEYFENSMNPSSTEEPSYPTWFKPLELHDYSRLPPSLWPITPESLADTSTFKEWG
ncbi:zinc finger matrin-type protein 5 [Andrena cerasifolii]|uniref:zinc finger matrin-type protein 5 n=1 Tax=Andrena cerasifolii TaxID=2819439 RepID=UPI0040377A92